MQRRTLLVSGGVALSALFAGCSSDDTEDIDGGTRNENDENGNGNGGSGSADLEIVDHELVVEEGDWSTDVYVEATVENNGSEPSGDVEIQADWYDEEGNYLDNDTGRLTSLGNGETWNARVYYLGTDAEMVADYELEGEFSEDVYEPAEGLTLVDSSMDTNGDELIVEGQVENESSEDQDYVEVVAKIYDAEGNVLGDDWTNVTDLRAGETWAFTFDYFSPDVRNRADEAADHEILVKDTAW